MDAEAVRVGQRVDERPHQADSDDDRDLWLRPHGYVTRRYGKRQIDERSDDVIAELLDARPMKVASAPYFVPAA